MRHYGNRYGDHQTCRRCRGDTRSASHGRDIEAAKACGVNLPDGVAERMINIDPLTMYSRPSVVEDVLKVSPSMIPPVLISMRLTKCY